MNLQLHHVISDVTGATGMKIIRAIVAGERDPEVLVALRDIRCKANAATLHAALSGNYQPEHLFALGQALALYDFYQGCIAQCDVQIEWQHSMPAVKSPRRRCRKHGIVLSSPMT